MPDGKEAHWEVVERVLFVFYKLNPGIKYIQGMNEIIGPIYYVFASDPKEEWRQFAEADTFYCFQNVMSEVKDYFIKTLDMSSCGIEQTMTQFYMMFEALDPELYSLIAIEQELIPQYYALEQTMTQFYRMFEALDPELYSLIAIEQELIPQYYALEQTMTQFYRMFEALDPELYSLIAIEQELIPQYYAFRWISLLLSQEFFLPDVIRIWDTLFSDPDRFNFLLYVCLAMLTHLREDLLVNDFTANMKCLQNYPPVDVGDILVEATQLKEKHLAMKN